jgi:hypothetical protein
MVRAAIGYTLAKSDNEDLAGWDFSRNNAVVFHSPNERASGIEYFKAEQYLEAKLSVRLRNLGLCTDSRS